jgi:hypothetical protein
MGIIFKVIGIAVCFYIWGTDWHITLKIIATIAAFATLLR